MELEGELKKETRCKVDRGRSRGRVEVEERAVRSSEISV